MLRCLIILLGVFGAMSAPTSAATSAAMADPVAEQVAIGRAIYLEGRLPSGAALVGARVGTRVSGAAAACVNCHRRSGMGSVEGDYLVSPVTGRALFSTTERVVATMDPRRGKLLNQAHEAYTTATFARALREGTHVSGRAMHEMMPRYQVGDAEVAALEAYLRTLSTEWSPGADDHKMHFATVIAPGVDPERRRIFLETLQTAVSQKNANTMPGKRHMIMAAEFALKTERSWDLSVWQLEGAPQTWGAQLAAHYAQEPVFAILSGLSNTTWAPVHDFCERQRVPCWFPSVDAVPESAANSLYSLYFTRGVSLEADVIAVHLRAVDEARRVQRVVQVYGDGEPGSAAAAALRVALENSDIGIEDHVLSDMKPETLREALSGLKSRDAVMFWLRADEVKALEGIAPPAAQLFFSGALADGEHAPLPASWKTAVRLVYPYALPQDRGANLAYFRAWLNQRRIPLLDEPLQDEVYFAVNYLSETIGEMLNNLYRDYLIERAESELSRREGRKAEEETRDRQQLRPIAVRSIEAGNTGGASAYSQRTSRYAAVITPEENLGKRTGTSVFPALSLAVGQRFASKGAYIVKFTNAAAGGLEPESDWIVP